MKVERIGERNLTIIHEAPFRTITHIVLGEKRTYICDTFLGTGSMEQVSNVLEKEGMPEKPIVVFNSHADWDHIWGNCYFKGSFIIAHRTSRQRILTEGEGDLEKWKEHIKGEAVLTPPNLLFDTNLFFADDNVDFFHTPGHTIDSSSLFDHEDKILFVGDNVESDIPHTNSLDFDTYISTLNAYLEKDWTALVAGHDPIQFDDKLVRSNIEYLKSFKEWSVDIHNMSEHARYVHLYSLEKLAGDLLETNIPDRAREHYASALEVARSMGPSEKKQTFIERFLQVVNHP